LKVVAVSQRVDDYPERKECRDALDQNLVRFLLAAACLAVPVPNTLLLEGCSEALLKGMLNEWLGYIRPEGIVLSGGNDPGACPERDCTENLLMEYAESHELPLLGICRGVQMMGLRGGVSLEPITGHVCIRHELNGTIYGDVNSFHNFALSRCPKDYYVLAKSADGVIEAIRHDILPWEGWMWHPEREAFFLERDVQRARRIFRCMV